MFSNKINHITNFLLFTINLVNLLKFFFVVNLAVISDVLVLTGNIDTIFGADALYFVFCTVFAFKPFDFSKHNSVYGADFSIAREPFITFQGRFGAGNLFAAGGTSVGFSHLVDFLEFLLALDFAVFADVYVAAL